MCAISKHYCRVPLLVELFAHDSILWEITTSFIQYLPWAVAQHDICLEPKDWWFFVQMEPCAPKKCVIAYIQMGKYMRMDREYFAMVVGEAVAVYCTGRLRFQQPYRWNVEWNKLRLLWLTPIGYASKILRLSLWWWILISARKAWRGFRSFEQKNNGVRCEQPFFARFSFRSSKQEKHEFSREITPAWHEKGEDMMLLFEDWLCLLCLKIMLSKKKSCLDGTLIKYCVCVCVCVFFFFFFLSFKKLVVNGELNSYFIQLKKHYLQIDPPFETERFYPQTCVF